LCPALGANLRIGLGAPILAKGIVSGSLLRCNITRAAAVAAAAASGINHCKLFELTRVRRAYKQ
jgi:hypothetical protein